MHTHTHILYYIRTQYLHIYTHTVLHTHTILAHIHTYCTTYIYISIRTQYLHIHTHLHIHTSAHTHAHTLTTFSDNGAWTEQGLDGGSNGLLRGQKGETWEGGMR